MSRRFSATQQTTIKDLQRIMAKINATSLRLDQDIMGGGVKVVFDRAGKRYVRECNKYDNSLDNLRVIGLQIEYLYRALEVYAEDIVESSFDIEFDRIFNGFLAAPDDTALLLGDGKAPWYEVLGVKEDATREDIRMREVMEAHLYDGPVAEKGVCGPDYYVGGYFKHKGKEYRILPFELNLVREDRARYEQTSLFPMEVKP